MSSIRYTLDEARIELARQHCELYGHQLELIHLVKTGWFPPPPGCPGGWHCRNCDVGITFDYPERPGT